MDQRGGIGDLGSLYFSHPACLGHDPRELSPGHPDTPERLVVLEREMAARDWLGWERREAPPATEDELELVHDARLVQAIKGLCERGGGAIDSDTCVGAGSWEASLRAAGAAAAMTRALLAGEAGRAYCAIRPSGHHAESGRAMGFCLFNNVAVAAATAIAELGVRRVLVLDWDVHHGNGTEEIFRGRGDVLFVSLHQRPLYPGTGALGETGVGEGEGHTINLPVPPGAREPLWLSLIDRVVLPAARAFEPELVLVSAGFDAHTRDPLAGCELETSSFATMAARVRDLAAELGAPVGVVQEGGYDAEVLAECVGATMEALAAPAKALGAAEEQPGALDPIVVRAIETHGRWWPLA
ncbi:MAG TPA: histone deacetylase [Solirubrobacteraceae bacterium]|nr:histone deacetylase [Solirubrobacteraceae bacterium]